jgi:hypothetical protein
MADVSEGELTIWEEPYTRNPISDEKKSDGMGYSPL